MIRSLLLALLISIASTAHAQQDAQRELARSQTEERQVLLQLRELDQELRAVEQELESMQGKVDQLDRDRQLREDELTAAEVALAEEVVKIRTWMHTLYRLNRQGLARLLFSWEDPADLRRRAYYVAAILRANRQLTQRFLNQVRARTEALERVESNRASLEVVQGQIRLQEATLRDERARRMAFLDKIRERKDMALRMMNERAAANDDFNRQLAGNGAITLTLPTADTSGRAFAARKGRLDWPVYGSILRQYGWYTDDHSGQRAQNHGLDIQAERYTPIRAVFAGNVSYVGYINGLGQTVVVDHGPYTTVYAHTSKVYVSQGQSVDEGDKIALVGETGLTDGRGPRLHFELRYENKTQNPMDWLGDQG